MTQAQMKFSFKFYVWIMRVKYKIRGWLFEQQDVFLKNKQAPEIAGVINI